MHILKTRFQSNTNLGLFGFATDSYCLLPKNLNNSTIKEIREILSVPIYQVTISNTHLIGVFCSGNESFIFVPDILTKYEMDELRQIKEAEIVTLKTKFTALGNNMAFKDDLCILNPNMESEVKSKLKNLGFKVESFEIANHSTVGNCLAINHKGCLTHIDTTEVKKISKLMGLNTNIGTVNFGSPYVRTGLILNSNGYLVGKDTTGPEIQRIDETLGFLGSQKRNN